MTPDEHVSTGFHEILLHDMGQDEWPQVNVSDIGCLRLDWPKDLFAFVGRYQCELEQMRKACRDRFGMPLFHRYRVFDRQGAHPAFRGPYMTRLFDFLKEADAESIRHSHRRRAKEIAASMSKGASTSKEGPATTTSSRRTIQRTPVSKIKGREHCPSLIPTAGRCQKLSTNSIYHRSAEKDTVQALIDLSLPRFNKRDDGVIPKTKPWPVAVDSPASPTSAEDGNRTRTPSPCMDLDELSMEGSVIDVPPLDFKVTLLYDSGDACTPVGSIVFSSNEDLPHHSCDVYTGLVALQEFKEL